jgi:signal transduction histidine kinase
VATTSQAAGQPAFGRPVRNPLSLLRVEVAGARLTALVGVVFFLQSVPLQMAQLPNASPVWRVVILVALIGSLAACVVAAISRRFVRPTYLTFTIVYVVVLVSWPFAVQSVDVAIADRGNYWLYLLLTIAAAMATVSMKPIFALAYTVLTPVIYGVIRLTPAGGEADPSQAALDSVYSILLGGGILILVTVLRAAASGVDIAQQNALARYSHAVRQHATEAERVQVDSIVHDSVLTTLLSAARAFSPEAKALAATMAGNAIGHLQEAVAVAPDSEATVSGEVVAHRIVDAAETMSERFAVRLLANEWCEIPVTVADAAYSASVQAMINSLQHAGPGVDRWLEIRSRGHQAFTIEIGDRGEGFDPTLIPTERLGVRVSILERVTSAGGRARIDSAPGEGTVITLEWEGEPDAAADERVTESSEVTG